MLNPAYKDALHTHTQKGTLMVATTGNLNNRYDYYSYEEKEQAQMGYVVEPVLILAWANQQPPQLTR
jgi:hypothetical protein